MSKFLVYMAEKRENSGRLVLGIDLPRKQRRIHFRCIEGSNASAEDAKLCFELWLGGWGGGRILTYQDGRSD